MVADLSSDAVSALRQYESLVLPLLARHGGYLERRLRTNDGLSEVHIVTFQSEASYEAYKVDDERQTHGALLDGIEVVQRMLRMEDV